ncbi:MAG: Predicted hydroxymethylpyrimidine transporter CytX, partial [uncultured Frankineae bacterium]
ERGHCRRPGADRGAADPVPAPGTGAGAARHLRPVGVARDQPAAARRRGLRRAGRPAALGHPVGRGRRVRDRSGAARPDGGPGGAGAGAGDGAAAGAARPPGELAADRPERPAVPGLGDLRDRRHRGGGLPGARRAAVAVRPGRRGAGHGDGDATAGRRARAGALRRLGRAGGRGLPVRRCPVRAAARGRGGRRRLVLVGRRHRHRPARLVVPAGRGLHAARARPAHRVPRDRGRLRARDVRHVLPRGAGAVGLRRGRPRRDRRPARGAAGAAGGARAGRGGGGRGVRQHLLDRGVDAERRRPARPAGHGGGRRHGGHRPRAQPRRGGVRAVPVPARLGVRPAGRGAAGRLLPAAPRRVGRLAGRARAACPAAALGGGLRRLPAHRADLLPRDRGGLDVLVGRPPGRPGHLRDARALRVPGQPHGRVPAHGRRRPARRAARPSRSGAGAM